MKINFEAGTGRHFEGGVNFMISDDRTIYAEIAVPDGASDDYGYLTMKKAILDAYHGDADLCFWYDGHEEDRLADDADIKAPVHVEIDV